jgi:hypothetical protein
VWWGFLIWFQASRAQPWSYSRVVEEKRRIQRLKRRRGQRAGLTRNSPPSEGDGGFKRLQQTNLVMPTEQVLRPHARCWFHWAGVSTGPMVPVSASKVGLLFEKDKQQTGQSNNTPEQAQCRPTTRAPCPQKRRLPMNRVLSPAPAHPGCPRSQRPSNASLTASRSSPILQTPSLRAPPDHPPINMSSTSLQTHGPPDMARLRSIRNVSSGRSASTSYPPLDMSSPNWEHRHLHPLTPQIGLPKILRHQIPHC